MMNADERWIHEVGNSQAVATSKFDKTVENIEWEAVRKVLRIRKFNFYHHWQSSSRA